MNTEDEDKIYYIKVRCRNIKTKQIFYKKLLANVKHKKTHPV